MALDADALDDCGLDAGVFRKRVQKPLHACDPRIRLPGFRVDARAP